MTSRPPICINGLVHPPEQITGDRFRSRPAPIMSQRKASLQQLPHFSADPYFVDGFSVEPSYLIQGRESERDIVLRLLIEGVVYFCT
jgi:hypothetical protein